MIKHYTHESEELNALLGKKVKVTLFDDTTITGILTRAEWKPYRYEVANYSFRKTHVKKIEVVR
nr:MAG TPA: Gemin6 6 [Caudoviricetes sp.]